MGVLRFFGAWITAMVSIALALVLLGGTLELIMSLLGHETRGVAESPLMLSIYWSMGAVAAVGTVGIPFVLLRRHIVRPDRPFLRPGYLAVMAAAFAACWSLGQPEGSVFAAMLQVPLLLGALIYIALARKLGIFAADEWPSGGARSPEGADGTGAGSIAPVDGATLTRPTP